MKLNAVRYVLSISVVLTPMLAHVSPPRVLVSDQEAAQALLPGARTLATLDLQLSPAQRQTIKKEWGWRPEEKVYHAYIGKDERGRFAGAVIFVSEITAHGVVRTAVGVDPEGKIKGATVVAVTDETYVWIKPLIDRNFARDYVGKDSRSDFLTAPSQTHRESMVKFYGQVLASLVKRGAVLYQAGLKQSAAVS